MTEKSALSQQISPKVMKGVFTVKNDRGLHTRPSTELVKCATNYKSDVKLIHRKQHVNAKSLLGILMLAATKGSKIRIEATGNDAEEAITSILKLAEDKFNIQF